MDDINKQIQNLKRLIDEKELNYKNALASNLNFNTLKEMRLQIRKMKEDLQVLLDKASE
ncbi:MAG TPA: hypothetical protein VHB70_15795 [Parafilimonas sp.]|nr:hypothetical protein [Parafilimonas sp.]